MRFDYHHLSLTLLLTVLTTSGCGGDDDGKETVVATHADALQALGKGSGCAVASCHGTTAEADLDLASATNLRTLLVGVAACEAPALKLVEPGDPARSWLWIKLTADVNSANSGDLKSQTAWGEAGNCAGAPGFGKRMPRVAPYQWSDDDLAVIKGWIEAGAPGPL